LKPRDVLLAFGDLIGNDFFFSGNDLAKLCGFFLKILNLTINASSCKL